MPNPLLRKQCTRPIMHEFLKKFAIPLAQRKLAGGNDWGTKMRHLFRSFIFKGMEDHVLHCSRHSGKNLSYARSPACLHFYLSSWIIKIGFLRIEKPARRKRARLFFARNGLPVC
ncbi:hypothetical protein KIY57_00230 [Heyndrickxia coagulans]|nr:hypothetical protein KIY57_00230 [Heyndrickxia coagulans]